MARNTYDSTGTYVGIISASNGCDSVITLNLSINNSNTTFIDTACGEYIYNGIVYDSSGIYFDTLASSYGCDSVIQLEITVFRTVL